MLSLYVQNKLLWGEELTWHFQAYIKTKRLYSYALPYNFSTIFFKQSKSLNIQIFIDIGKRVLRAAKTLDCLPLKRNKFHLIISSLFYCAMHGWKFEACWTIKTTIVRGRCNGLTNHTIDWVLTTHQSSRVLTKLSSWLTVLCRVSQNIFTLLKSSITLWCRSIYNIVPI